MTAPRARSFPEAPSDGVADAIASYAEAVHGPEEAPPVRDYRQRDVAVILGVCAALLVAFDSEGLMTWVQRMELGPVQRGWRAVLAPVNAAMDQIGLTAPRRWLVSVGEASSTALGAGEDPVLAGGWDLRVEPAALPAPPLSDEPEADFEVPLPDRLDFDLEEQMEPLPPDAKFTVLLMGDSMIAGSLGAALSRALMNDSRMRVVRAFQTATGLSRPDVYDWMKVLPPLLEREKPRLIICSLGANDPTTISAGDQALEYGERGWRRAYAGRVLEMMRALTGSGARVLWLGLPPMRPGRFSNHTQYLNSIFAQTAKKVRGVEFLELRMLVSDAQGEYATFVPGPDGKLVRYRLDDGIHYSPAGARAISRWVIDWIEERYRR